MQRSAATARGDRLGRAALAAAFVLCAACRPETLGRCTTTAECRTGSVCNQQLQLCVRDTATCVPACGAGTTCAGGACVPLVPVVTLKLPANPVLSPSLNGVVVKVEADPQLTLGALTVEAATDKVVAKGSLPAAAAGEQTVKLTTFDAAVQATGTVTATLAYTGAGGAAMTVRSVNVPALVDSTGPSASVSVAVSGADAPDAANGWLPRTAGNAIVRALVIDAGAGPASATLDLKPCPTTAGVACSYPGVLQGAVVQGAGTWKFAVPRAAQAVGSEARVAFTVKAKDAAGNESPATGSLPIDDKPPALGAPVVKTAGVAGEDGRTWFPAGAHGVEVEVAVPVSDSGAGFEPAGVTLTLEAADVDPGQPTAVAGFLPAVADGAVHFKIPTGRSSGREGPLRFAVAAKDLLGHAAALPASSSTQLLVDDVPPQVTLATPGYASLLPPFAEVCARPDSATFKCGRGDSEQRAERALRDDSVSAGFLVWDCGAGVAAQLPTWTVESGGAVQGPFAAQDWSTQPSRCAGLPANLVHAQGLVLDVGALAALDAPDLEGSVRARLRQTVKDRVGLSTTSPAAASGDGTVRVSLWRWRSRLAGPAAGDPALLAVPSATAGRGRALVVAVDGSGAPGTPAIEVLGADGAQKASLRLVDARTPTATPELPAGEVVVGASALWVVGQPAACNGASTCSRLWRVGDPLGASPLVSACPGLTGAIGGLALRRASGAAVEAAVATVARLAGSDLAATFVEDVGADAGRCKQLSAPSIGLPGGAGAVSGVSLGGGLAFLSSLQGFVSAGLDDAGKLGVAAAAFLDPLGPLAMDGPPALAPGTPTAPVPFFNARAGAADPRLRRASFSTSAVACAAAPACWVPAGSPWSDGAHAAAAGHTPVFDAGAVWTVDDKGTLEGFARPDGARVIAAPGLAPIDAADPGAALAQPVSPPLLLQGGAGDTPLVLVQANGLVRLLRPAAGKALTAVKVGPFPAGARPRAPVADLRGATSVVYVLDGGCDRGGAWSPAGGCASAAGPPWVWALQLDAPPLDASADAWPRPGRDSCNGKHAEGVCP